MFRRLLMVLALIPLGLIGGVLTVLMVPFSLIAFVVSGVEAAYTWLLWPVMLVIVVLDWIAGGSFLGRERTNASDEDYVDSKTRDQAG